MLIYNKYMKKFLSVFLFAFLAGFSFAEEIYVCVASFKNPENAERLSKNLEASGKENFIFETESNGQKLFRVLLSDSFESKSAARNFRDSVQNSDFAKKLNLEGLWICEAQKPPVKESAGPSEKSIALLENKTEISLSDEKPYSVLVHSYKDEPSAENGKTRLQEKEIDSYILKTFDENTYFSFDLHSGAFESSEEAADLQEKLEQIGISGSEISDYKDEKSKIQKYDEVIKSQPVVYDFGKTEIPEICSESVATIIRQFPINENFALESLSIFDIDNIRNLDEELPSFDEFSDIIDSPEKIHAFSVAHYKDDLFDKNVQIAVFSGDENSFFDMDELKKEIFENYDSEEELNENVRYSEFQSKGEILNSVILKDEEEYVFLGINKKRDLAVFMTAEDFAENQFEEFLNDFKNDSSLLVYPQIRRTLLVLPKNSDIRRDFLSFNLKKVDESYAEAKNYEDWAIPIVGHWNAEAKLCQEDEIVSVGFFDLDYDFNAKQVHGMFMDSHIVTETSHSSYVKNAESWFVDTFDNNKEVSFSTKSYIVAVDSYELDEPLLVILADDLQIWEY